MTIKRRSMAQPVVHFEVVGKDGDRLKSYYAEMFDLEVKDDNPKAESLGGTRVMGPETIMEGITLGQFLDPEGNVVGLTQSAS
jgi:uncharacterized protein